MAERSGAEVLQSEIEKSKDKLRSYNENIKKLTGRDPSRPEIRRLLSGEGTEREENDYSGRVARGRGRIFGLARLGVMEDSGPPAKRRAVGGAFSRLGPMPARRREREDSPYEEELPNKLSVQSSVVATSRESKNRKEILQEQTKDKEGMQRNRRMFGLLLGTLNKFKTDSKTLQTKEVQRKKIEEKLEENAEKEKRKFKQETKLLIEEMHLEQSKISRLQQKMEIAQEHADREVEVMKLKNFIVTKTRPRIFWKPQQMSAALENKLKESKKFVDGKLQESRDRLESEIKELMERETKREERIKMRLREDGLLEDEEGKAEGEEGNKNETDRETGRVVIEVKEETDGANTISDRLGRHFEEGMGDESEEEEENLRKKPRRTVVVEREASSDSETEDEEIVHEDQNKDIQTNKSGSENKGKTELHREPETNKTDVQSSEEEMEISKGDDKRDRSYSSKSRDKELGARKASTEDRNDSDVEVERHREGKRNGDKDRNKDRSHNDSRKNRERNNKEDSQERDSRRRDGDKKTSKRDSANKEDIEERNSRRRDGDKKNSKRDSANKEDSEERDNRRRDGDKKSSKHDSNNKEVSEERDSRRRDGDKKSAKRDSGDKSTSKKDRREEKRDKEHRRDSYNENKQSKSRHTKSKKRHSDSDESDIEIKQEKEISLNKSKDLGQLELVRKSKNSTTVEEEVEMVVV